MRGVRLGSEWNPNSEEERAMAEIRLTVTGMT